MEKAASGSRGSYLPGRKKRAEILSKAMEIIGTQGYEKSTLRGIATAVGLSNAGLLHYFASKEDLFSQVLALRDEDHFRTWEGRGTPVHQLIEVMRNNQDVPGLSLLYSSLLAEAAEPQHAAHDFFVDRFSALTEWLAADIAEQRPDWDAALCQSIARTLLATADGLQSQWLLDDSVDVAGGLATLVKSLGLNP